MADLQNLQISATYDGLIKTNDEQPVTATLKTLQDGSGNDLPLQLSTTTVNFTDTVTGIDGLAPAGGTSGQVLTKDTATDYDYSWVTPSGGGGGLTAFSIPYTLLSGPSSGDAIGAYIRIPANSFANGDLLNINGTVIKNNPTGWQYLQVRISPNITGVFDGVQIGTDQSPNGGTTLPVYINKTLAISTNNSRTYGQDENTLYDTAGRQNIVDGDINWAVDQYLTFVYYIDDAAATCRVENITIAKIN